MLHQTPDQLDFCRFLEVGLAPFFGNIIMLFNFVIVMILIIFISGR